MYVQSNSDVVVAGHSAWGTPDAHISVFLSYCLIPTDDHREPSESADIHLMVL
jgi:hypothetical protein